MGAKIRPSANLVHEHDESDSKIQFHHHIFLRHFVSERY